jgi:predicted TIM-barrel fold metal-dependent hydrolase
MDDLLAVMTEYFTRYGPRAAAVKLAVAYARPIATQVSPARVTGEVFKAWLRREPVSLVQARAIEDAVIEAGLGLASDQGLAVKVHTGLHVGTDRMDLHDVRHNIGDVVTLARRFPTMFVVMHIGYPYEGELIAAAKHHTNVVADLCWAWIIDPIGSRRFLERFLVSAPASKVLCFGGDYIPVENIVGHAALARRELGRALENLRDEGYLDEVAACELVPDLMHRNAERIFRTSRGVPG